MNAMFRLGQRLLPGLLATTLGALALTSAHAGGTPWIRDADNPDRNRFQVAATGTLQAPFVNGFVMVPTPKGKRYFIDYVTLNCTLNSATDSVTQVYLSVLQTTAATSASTSAVP
jgi:hypothetical protein